MCSLDIVGLGSRIRDVEGVWCKTEIKIIHIVPFCVIVCFTQTLNFWYVKLKLKKCQIFSEVQGWFFFHPILSHKIFATNLLKYNFLEDVWFGQGADYDNIQTNSYWFKYIVV